MSLQKNKTSAHTKEGNALQHADRFKDLGMVFTSDVTRNKEIDAD